MPDCTTQEHANVPQVRCIPPQSTQFAESPTTLGQYDLLHKTDQMDPLLTPFAESSTIPGQYDLLHNTYQMDPPINPICRESYYTRT